MNPNIPPVLSFWFAPGHHFTRWFIASEDLDRQIKSNFGDLVSQARTPSLDHWTENPQGTLAILILLDQFPRNIFRGSPESFSSDPKALDVAVKGIAQGHDRAVLPIQQAFFYLPLMHSERLLAQVSGLAAYEGMLQRCQKDEEAKAFAESGLDFARRHRDVILKFGRFPSRNAILGRESTVEEKDFLKENPSGF